jgi:hypothetical protein
MKVALVILCIGAVTFLLRVLGALVKEALSWRPGVDTVPFAPFNSSRQRTELIEMDLKEQMRRPSLQAGRRMAL